MAYALRWMEDDCTVTLGETITLHTASSVGSVVFEDGVSIGYIISDGVKGGIYEYTPTALGTYNLQYGNTIDCKPLNVTVVSPKIFLKVKLDNILQLISNKVTSWSQTPSDDKYPSEKLVKDSLDNHTHNSQISYGKVDSTSTSTVFTATVPNLTLLTDGTTVMLRNGVVTSASGFTLNVNNLGAKPVYNSMADASADTTIFNINYTMLFVYDSTRINGGCWICYRGYNSNDNTIGHQIRTNNQKIYATDKTYRYRILLEVDDTHYMPVNLSTSTSADTSKTSTMNTREFKLDGNIIYYSYTSAINQNAQFGNAYQWKQYPFNLGYSFNNTSSALALTQWSPVYIVAEKSATNEGMAKLVSPYYTQSLPNSADGKLYIFLGQAYSTTNIEMVLEHPIYEYKNGKIRLYRDYYTTSETDTLLNGKANSSHTHTKSQITDFSHTHDDRYYTETETNSLLNNKLNIEDAFSGSYNDLTNKPTIPSKISDLTDDSDFIEKSNTVGLIKNDGTVMQSGTGSSNWAIGNHTHSAYVNPTKVTSWSSTPSDNNVASEKLIKDSLDNKIGKSSTVGLIKNDGTVDTTSYSTFNGNYNNLTNKPTIPTKTSDLTNDGDGTNAFITQHQSLTNYVQKSSTNGLLKNDGTVDTNSYLTTANASSTYVAKETGKGLFTGSYSDLTNKPSYTATVTSSTTGAYKLGSINISGSSVDIYGKDTHQSLTDYIQKSSTSGLVKNDGSIMTGGTGASNFAIGNHNHSYNDLTNKPTIPTKTSDLQNDSGFLTQHQSLTNYLQQSDVKNNLTSTDTNKPLSANQGKELKTLVDAKANLSDLEFNSVKLDNLLDDIINYGIYNDIEW